MRSRLAFVCSLLVPLTIGAQDFPSGIGFVESVVGDPGVVRWSLSTIGGFDLRNSGIAPAFCTGTCRYDFNNVFSDELRFGTFGLDLVRPTLVFHGPVATTTASCGPVFPPFPTNCLARWPTVSITVTGDVRLISTVVPGLERRVSIVGTGTAWAETQVSLGNPGPWDYRQLRYDFTYAVVPEPGVTSLLLIGFAGVGVWGRRLSTRGARRPTGA
jgi:hypothetical protein